MIGQHLLEQVQGLDVEVVGGLVEDQEVGGLGQDLGEQQTVALAAGERLDRLAGLLVAKQEVAQIAHHVAREAVDLNPVAAMRAEHPPGSLLGVELGAVLVEAGDLEPGAQPDGAAVRFELAGEQFQERGLAGAVGAKHAHPVAAQDAGGEGLQDGPVAEALGDPLGLDHQPPAHAPACRRAA